MAKRKRRKAGKRGTKKSQPGWLYMAFGLTLGLAVAAGIYVNDRRNGPVGASQSVANPPAASAVPSTAVVTAEPEPEADTQDDTVGFDFYEMLPNLDVEIFEDRDKPRKTTTVPAKSRVITPGIYILQAGSFTRLADAQRREGEIALLGIRAEVRKGEANGRSVYRVYTMALNTPDEVNSLRARLNENGIETLAKRVSD